MLLAFTMVFVGIKHYRDKVLGGVIRFLPALGVGLGISAVASLFWVVGWEITLATGFDFGSAYSESVVAAAEARGAPAAELERIRADTAEFLSMYENPLFRLPITFIEMFPIGVLISLIRRHCSATADSFPRAARAAEGPAARRRVPIVADPSPCYFGSRLVCLLTIRGGFDMAKKNETGQGDSRLPEESGVSRRDLLKSGAAVGLGAAALLEAGCTDGQDSSASAGWDYEADVVIAGGGCAGLTAAIRARELGATVLVVDQNFDLGGRMLHSGSFVSLGGGDPLQLRDKKGESDKEGYVTIPPVESPEELDDNVDLLFTDITDWSILNRRGETPYRYNERELMRAWAENCGATRQFLMDNYVRFGRINGTHEGGGMSRARGAMCFFMLGDKTDIKAARSRPRMPALPNASARVHSHPCRWTSRAASSQQGAVSNGVALSRPLEFSAREKGVQFMLFRNFDELVREEPFAGRVVGIKAQYSPRMHPETGERLQSFWQNGNVEERRETIRIRARKAVDPRERRACGQSARSAACSIRPCASPRSRRAVRAARPERQDASALIAA